MSTGAAATCPSCGAPIRFGGAHSLAVVCGYCKSTVRRRGAELDLLGKVPDLVATDTRLALHLAGRIDNVAFTILGHVQLARPGEHGQPDATWDEWYAGFSDDTWGWLAEAQGRLYVTRLLDGRTPTLAFDVLHAGQRLEEPSLGMLAVDEVGESIFVAAEGELPFAPRLGDRYRFADLTSGDGGFYTFDYGAADAPQAEAQVFGGHRVRYDEAGLGDRAPDFGANAPEAAAIDCPKCGAPLTPRSRESVSLTCPSCHSLLEREGDGVRLLFELASRESPPLALGSKGEIGGEVAEVLGWMRRSTEVEGVRYFWDEYLLHGASGYRWLTEGDGQWHLVAPIEAGRVTPNGDHAEVAGRSFRHFQDAKAIYEQVQGEFYWRVSYDKVIATTDYVAPPSILSRERDHHEESWSLGHWVSADYVWKAFAQKGQPPRSTVVGAAQPNPYSARAKSAWVAGGISLAVLPLLGFLLAGVLPHQSVLSVDIPLGGTTPETQVYVSDPFELTGSRQAVEIKANAACDQSWVGLDTALIADETGESDAVGLDLSYYHGVDDGESWSEGSRAVSETIGSVPAGRYVLRVEPQTGKDPSGTLPDTVHVEVIRGPFLWPPPLAALFLLLLWPLYLSLRGYYFERRRWENSDHPMGSS